MPLICKPWNEETPRIDPPVPPMPPITMTTEDNEQKTEAP